MKHNYELIVGNIGTMPYTNKKAAIKDYNNYVLQSKAGNTRCSNEPVTLFKDGEIIKEYTPKSTKTAYFDYIGSIELPIEIIELCPLSGACDTAIAIMRKLPEVIAELSQIEPAKLIQELSKYGAWEPEELANHEDNLDRILWLACSDIREGKFDEITD